MEKKISKEKEKNTRIPPSIRVISCNVNSARRRRHEAEIILQEEGIDVLMLQETLLKPAMKFNIAGFISYRDDAGTGRRGTNKS